MSDPDFWYKNMDKLSRIVFFLNTLIIATIGQTAFLTANASYTKLDADGNVVPDNIIGHHSCVHDNNTGLVWEVKTQYGGIRDRYNRYSWYDPNSDTNGGHAGYPDLGACSGGISCDTYSYVQAVNALAGW